MTADAYATAISVMPKEKAFAFLHTHKEIGYVVMTQDGTVHYGNLDGLVSLDWLEKSEKSTKSKTKTKSSTTVPIIHNFTHPDANISNEIKK